EISRRNYSGTKHQGGGRRRPHSECQEVRALGPTDEIYKVSHRRQAIAADAATGAGHGAEDREGTRVVLADGCPIKRSGAATRRSQRQIGGERRAPLIKLGYSDGRSHSNSRAAGAIVGCTHSITGARLAEGNNRYRDSGAPHQVCGEPGDTS